MFLLLWFQVSVWFCYIWTKYSSSRWFNCRWRLHLIQATVRQWDQFRCAWLWAARLWGPGRRSARHRYPRNSQAPDWKRKGYNKIVNVAYLPQSLISMWILLDMKHKQCYSNTVKLSIRSLSFQRVSHLIVIHKSSYIMTWYNPEGA